MREQRPNKQPALGGGDAQLVLALVGLLASITTAAGLVWCAAALTGVGYGSPRTWVSAPAGPRWTTAASVVLGCEVVLAGLLVVAPVVWVVARVRAGRGGRGGDGRRVWTDGLGRVMSSRRDLADLTEGQVAKDTARLRAGHVGVGLPLGRSVAHHVSLWATYEWSQVWVMGMRSGKTRRVAVPQILSHHGPVVATSNKDDIHDYTRGPREEIGRTWVNDPQGIVDEPASWWWNPLTFVTTVERAEQLVAIWAASRTSEDTSGVDPYFEPEGRSLAATLLVAAAEGGELVTRLPDWLSGEPPEPGVPDPIDYLRAAGFVQMAKDVEKLLRLDKGQRDGVYGTAASFFRWLRDPRYVRWVTPVPVPGPAPCTSSPVDPGDEAHRAQRAQDAPGSSDELVRAQFDPAVFVRSCDTLYLLSKEGPGSARAITGALVLAVFTAAEDLARKQGGRCRTPVLLVLDEAANVCRWPDLPNVYSHAGGRGILLVTILQAVSQGREVWGELGFSKMWSFTNVLGIGRGLNDVNVLSDLSRLIGERQIRDRSLSHGSKGHRSSSVSIRSERIMDESDLRALPMGRVILLASGVRPVLMASADFTQRADGWKATASRACYQAGRGINNDDGEVDEPVLESAPPVRESGDSGAHGLGMGSGRRRPFRGRRPGVTTTGAGRG